MLGAHCVCGKDSHSLPRKDAGPTPDSLPSELTERTSEGEAPGKEAGHSCAGNGSGLAPRSPARHLLSHRQRPWYTRTSSRSAAQGP